MYSLGNIIDTHCIAMGNHFSWIHTNHIKTQNIYFRNNVQQEYKDLY